MKITRHTKEIGTLALKHHAEIYYGFVAKHKVSFYETPKLPVRLLSKALHVLFLP
jgi:hypothetical protein